MVTSQNLQLRVKIINKPPSKGGFLFSKVFEIHYIRDNDEVYKGGRKYFLHQI